MSPRMRARAARARRRVAFPYWPDSDRHAWEREMSEPPTPLDQPGRGVHLSAASRRVYEHAWGHYLAWLRAQDIALDAPLAERVTPTLFAGWLAHLRAHKRSAQTIHNLLEKLVRALDLLEPSPAWKQLRRLPGWPTPSERRATRRLEPEMPDAAVLLTSTLAACDEAKARPLGRASALAFRNAFMIAFAMLHPFRRRSLGEIELGSGLTQIAAGVWRLHVSRTKLKTGFDVRLASVLVPHLEHYLGVVRPYLMGGAPEAHAHLWVGPSGRHLVGESLYRVFRDTGKRQFRCRLYPHQVRHLAATSVLGRDPRALALATAILGNGSSVSVNGTYDRSGREASLSMWRELRRRIRRR